jgi:hypothetical protein
MARGKQWATGLALLACLAMAGSVWAQVQPDHDLSWHVLAGGGRDASSDGYSLRGTLGQLAIGSGQSASHILRAGYWYGLAGLTRYEVYLPVVIRRPSP